MDTAGRDLLLDSGFIEDGGNKILLELFTRHKKFKEVNISVRLTKPFMLLARSAGKDVAVEVDCMQGTRLVLEKGSGRYRTAIMDIPLNEITGSLVKNYGNKIFQFEFEVRGFQYSLVMGL